MSEQSVSSLLVLVVDTNPVWWGSRGQDAQLQLSECIDTALVFANAHLMLSHSNKLAVIAAHSDTSHFLYPVRQDDQTQMETDSGDAPTSARDGKYELFSQVEGIVKHATKQLVLKNLEGEVSPNSVVAGALAMALCYIHRLEKECTIGEKLSSRILVLKGAEDNPSQYMNFMNAVFTAQKQNVVIDACVLEKDSGLLQQACDISGGIYLKVPQETALLQYLLWLFLPDPTVRSKLTLPPRAQVDYRAACFCHRHLIDIGYVCSVCLSIFCMFSPICSTCQTTFKILGPPKSAKKKSKKST
ncbi:general transcription factor IIH subunit 3-like isoform X2 [Babylonia areolata]|uniref:general transcription factor IIH subunit 3-like isoform X2 n=1 Tax=Babylonia areolata TaxID=304850 RepID=UPI003FD31298